MRILPLLLLAPALLSAQDLAPKELPPPTWTVAEGFSGLRYPIELSDGRLVVIDWKDNRIVGISADGKTLTNIGRVGAGPGEFKQPIELIRLSRDTVLVLDQELRRFLVLGPDLKPVTTFRFPDSLASALISARAADSRGRIYMTGSFSSRKNDGKPEATSIIAWDRATNRVDTVVTIQGGASIRQDIKREGFTGSAVYPIRFTPADDWVLLPNDQLVVAHNEPYGVDIVNRGTTTKGPRYTYSRVEVDAKERVPAAIAQMIPDTKPAFFGGRTFAGGNGDVWIARSMHTSAATRRYDRFDAKGNRTMSVSMPKAVQIMAVGRDALYTVRTDDDGLNWLEKRPLPK